MSMSKNLTELVSKTTAKTLFVLDIDSSLVLTHKRNEAIVRRFAQSISARNPQLSQQLATLECLPMEYGYFAALERSAPQISKEDAESLHSYWKEHFFSNDFLSCDLAHRDAVRFVNTLKEQKRSFVYLTGRPSDRMRPGTLATLSTLGFPISDDILFMKPNDSYVDESYKADILASIIAGYEQVLFIDNEPRVLLQIEKHHPQVELVFVDTCHSPNVTAPTKALVIKDFTDLTNELIKAPLKF